MTNIQTLPIEKLRIDGGTQARVAINEAVVEDYAERLTDGVHLPAVDAVFDGTSHYLTDGFHRLLASVRIGAKTIEVNVKAGTLHDAKLAGFSANKGHGLQRSNADKRKAVAGTLALVPDWSDRAIAKHIGVSNNMVSEARNQATRKAAEPAATSAGVSSDDTQAAPPPAAAERQAPDYEASAPAPTPAPAAAQQEAEAPFSDEQLDAAEAEHNDKLAALEAILDADDKLAAAVAENVKLREQNRILSARVLGLTNECAQAIRLAKSWRLKCERAGK